MAFNGNLEVGKNVYIILENKIKFDAYNVMEHWYAQDDIVIRCPIINTMTMEDGTLLYNIRFNNEIYQLPCYESYAKSNNRDLGIGNFTDDGCVVVKYGKLCCNPNGDYCETLGNTNYFAFYDYNSAVKRFRWLFAHRFEKIQDQFEHLIKNMEYINKHIDNDISVDADEFDMAVRNSLIAANGGCMECCDNA